MRSKLTILASLALAVCVAASPIARADDLKIAVCNPLKVLQQMQEFKDLEAKAKAEQQDYSGKLKQKQDAIQTMKDSLNLLLPDSPQYAQQNEELLKAAIDYKNFGDLAQQHVVRQEKIHIKSLFDKIQAAAGKVAQEKGFMLVISSHQPQIENAEMDNIDAKSLTAALLIQRVVLYSDPKMDITEDVLVELDKDYNASGGATTPPPTDTNPAPAPSGH
jgi:Skp family chaperone for outer membrane proteins